jgi:hypothetical protein
VNGKESELLLKIKIWFPTHPAKINVKIIRMRRCSNLFQCGPVDISVTSLAGLLSQGSLAKGV